jgi:hypothetical protein
MQKEQRARKKNDNCFVQRNNKRAKGNSKFSKGTTGAQRDQKLFRSKEQQVFKRNNVRAKGTTIVSFKGTTSAQK